MCNIIVYGNYFLYSQNIIVRYLTLGGMKAMQPTSQGRTVPMHRAYLSYVNRSHLQISMANAFQIECFQYKNTVFKEDR